VSGFRLVVLIGPSSHPLSRKGVLLLPFWVQAVLRIRIRDLGSGIRDGDSSDPGWKKIGSGINIPDPQHWVQGGRHTRLRRRGWGTQFQEETATLVLYVYYNPSIEFIFFQGGRSRQIPGSMTRTCPQESQSFLLRCVFIFLFYIAVLNLKSLSCFSCLVENIGEIKESLLSCLYCNFPRS
jgi:hypothetical protein